MYLKILAACPPAPRPLCSADFRVEELKLEKTGCPHYVCVKMIKEVTCTIQSGVVSTFDHFNIDAELCDNVIAQQQDQWKITSTYLI